eukprot:TRINITY_DN60810_c0_g1_i1.p1 TRINITY_DN60810_c0_g1~~TRINITY_DN60810_c0_g1_i1.p1  ORF type:complete len:756 (+),score=107.24 TRINITY_DN60810_c0_g1_i1:73-2340(+)
MERCFLEGILLRESNAPERSLAWRVARKSPRPSPPVSISSRMVSAAVARRTNANRHSCCLPIFALLAAERCSRSWKRRSNNRRPKSCLQAYSEIPISKPQAKPQDFCKKKAKIEILAPSNRWREGTVVAVGRDGVTVHYNGYDTQFDEQIKYSSGRLREFGALHQAKLQEKKQNFVLEVQGNCPGCGVKLQCRDKLALGYIPPEKIVQEAPAEAPKVLKPEDEVKLLLQEEGVEELSTPAVFSTRATQTTYKVIANVYLDIREEPDVNSARVQGESLAYGDTFQAAEIHRGSDARSYFRLADGRGWVFDWGVIRGAKVQLIEPVSDGRSQIKAAREAARQAVCMRCWGLWHYNDCDEVLRPSYGGKGKKAPREDLSMESFEALLKKTLQPVQEACIIAVVDVFDFGPSFVLLEYLATLLKGKRSIRLRIVANKFDLLPKDASTPRVRAWVAQEAQRAGHRGMKITDVYPVSCHLGWGIKELTRFLDSSNSERETYIVGAANAGKSSLLNRLTLRKRKAVGQIADADAQGFSVSVLPGTTLAPLAMKYNQGKMRLIDMPGLLVPGTYAERLAMQDLKEITPQQNGAFRLTFRMEEGQSILIGGLARLDFAQGKPCDFTVFVCSKVKLHVTRIYKAEAVAKSMAGDQLTPPMDAGRFDSLLPWSPHRFEVAGLGWDEAGADIVFPGLGWVAITGSGEFVVDAHAPEGIKITKREPLMPFEAKWTGVRPRAPGWYRVNGNSTRGFEVGRAREKLKAKF